MNKEFKPFQPILVKQGVWRAAYFSHLAKDGNVITTGGGVYYTKLVLPYEGNESLLGTNEDPKPKRWMAKIEGEYYYIDDTLVVRCSFERHDFIDKRRWQIGNYFRTREEAEGVLENIKKLLNID